MKAAPGIAGSKIRLRQVGAADEQNYQQGRPIITLNQAKRLSALVSSAVTKTKFIHWMTVIL